MNKNRKSARSGIGKRPRNRLARKPKFIELKNYLARNSVAFLAILVTICTSVTVYYLAYSEPDIRSVSTYSVTVLGQKIDDKNNLVFYVSCKEKLKNLSIKSGFVDKVEFVPVLIDIIPEVKLTHIDKTVLRWHEEKEIEILFLVTVNSADGRILTAGKNVLLELKLFDNHGKQIAEDPYGRKFKIIATLWSEDPKIAH